MNKFVRISVEKQAESDPSPILSVKLVKFFSFFQEVGEEEDCCKTHGL
jgi:hypothetical protein